MIVDDVCGLALGEASVTLSALNALGPRPERAYGARWAETLAPTGEAGFSVDVLVVVQCGVRARATLSLAARTMAADR
jgi:hypothetical protein